MISYYLFDCNCGWKKQWLSQSERHDFLLNMWITFIKRISLCINNFYYYRINRDNLHLHIELKYTSVIITDKNDIRVSITMFSFS